MKISIVTPSFNQGQYIEETIKSVIEQDYDNFEYFVIDNCSTDNTVDILKKYKNRINKLIIEKDAGQADALKKGFNMAEGDILCYLNSDDILLQNTFKYVVRFFINNPAIDAIYSHRIFIDDNSNIIKYWILPFHNSYFMSRWDFIPQETCFWRKSLMNKANGINSDFRFAMDYDLFARMMKAGKFKRVNKFLAAFREHPHSKTTLLLDTIGQQEIERVRQENSISIKWLDKALLLLNAQFILQLSKMFFYFTKPTKRHTT